MALLLRRRGGGGARIFTCTTQSQASRVIILESFAVTFRVSVLNENGKLSEAAQEHIIRISNGSDVRWLASE